MDDDNLAQGSNSRASMSRGINCQCAKVSVLRSQHSSEQEISRRKYCIFCKHTSKCSVVVVLAIFLNDRKTASFKFMPHFGIQFRFPFTLGYHRLIDVWWWWWWWWFDLDDDLQSPWSWWFERWPYFYYTLPFSTMARLTHGRNLICS